MRKSIIIIFFSLFIVYFNDCHSQVMFGTSHAVVDVAIHTDDSLKIVQSKDVRVALNYETAEFAMFLETLKLTSPSDSLLDLTDKIPGEEISYHGVFDIDYIKSTNHPPMSFEVTGDLQLGNLESVKLTGRGDLVHISDGAYPCQLSMQFKIQSEELEGIFGEPLNFDYIIIEFQQVILKEDFE